MFRILDSLQIAFERLWNNRILVLWALVGLTSATTLALSLPLYVDSVNTRLLASQLDNPPYAFRFRYLGAWKGNIKYADVDSATDAIQDGFTKTLGLPVASQVRYERGGAWTTKLGTNKILGPFSIGTLQGADSQIKITSGKWPPDPVKAGDPLPVLIPDKMLFDKGVQTGDALTTSRPGGKPLNLKVAATWTAANPNDPNWIFPPKFFDEILLVQPDDLAKALDGIEKPVEESAWYVIFDGSNIRTSDVGPLLNRVTDGQRNVEAVLPGIRLEKSPVDGLTAFSKEVNQLTQQLMIMILPVAGLVLYFVSLIAGLLVSRQQTEDVTLRSRGMSRRGIIGVHFLMWLILAGIAFAIGFGLSPLVVRLVGQTTSFLRFDNTDAPLMITFTSQALMLGAATALIAASSGLYMAWLTSRQTITSFKQQSARASSAWWQRTYLDILILIPAYYVLYTLSRQGGLVTSATDPFSNPISFLGPTLFALGNTLLFLRLWPFLLRIGAKILSYGRGIALLMALRELTRSIGRYRGGLLMMCFTLSLTGYTASMASTIDRSLVDSIDYKIGADSVLITSADAQTQEGAADANGQTTQTVTGFNTLPATDLLDVPGVANVARVGRYDAQLKLPSQRLDGTILAIDRGSMASIVRFRSDYATMPVADLFNLLAGRREGVLLNTATATKYNLRVGQDITYSVNALNQWYDAKVPIVGLVNYFPTLDPTQKFFLIANIDPVWETVGTELPHDIWIQLAPGADPNKVEEAVKEKGFPVVQWLDPAQDLHAAQTAPSRRGVLGFLSIGFIASVVLTLVGSIIQSTASFRAQSVQLGSLRAMGLGGFAVGVYLIVSQGLSVVGGILGGTIIGALATILYLPLLDFGGGLPPYLVRVAWGDIFTVYAIFAGVLFGVTLFTTWILGRQSLFTVVKLGEVG
ncbi:MAG: ABC transporter permease [Chloroflexota bacterium]